MEFIRRIVVCGLYPRTFTAESAGEAPVLVRDGSNFASWYRHMMLEHQDLVRDFVAAVRDVIDDFASIRLERVGTEARALTAKTVSTKPLRVACWSCWVGKLKEMCDQRALRQPAPASLERACVEFDARWRRAGASG